MSTYYIDTGNMPTEQAIAFVKSETARLIAANDAATKPTQ